MSYSGSFGQVPSPRGRSSTFGLDPSPRGRSASRHDDDIFGSPRSRSSRSKSRPRLTEAELGYDPLNPIFGSSRPPRSSSRSRRPSLSVAYTGASFLSPGSHDPDYLVPISWSPASRSPRSTSRYPPSASKSGSLSGRSRSRSRRRSSISLSDAPPSGVFPFELGTDELLGYTPDGSSRRPRAASSERRAQEPFKSRSGTASWSDDDPYGPSGISRRPTAPALDQPFKSKFFGSGTSSSSGSDPSIPRPLEGDPSFTGGRRSRSSGRSKDSSLFGRASGEEDFALPLPTTSIGRTGGPRGYAQTQPTSFKSGFSDQMEYDENGQEHFRPGTEIHARHSAYKDNNRRARFAIAAYKDKKMEFPSRKQVLSGPDAAIGESNRYGLGGNFTIPEHQKLRSLAHDGFKHRRAETIGRESFNKDYANVWEKRALQTEQKSDLNHERVAREIRQNANDWRDTRERHAEAMVDLGFPETSLTPYSSWGSGGRSHRS
ncbi:uncharacterized protein B0H64DRAFT_447710 [Chaetomium fimeti]|uniref:Uncharacterized protein n=1 Tax=Chaetomium fimeti TaxID=1854472 RepID=A0AAE0HQA8_9PEZI|nr:hypothetical protein B0H64DRAFT_447710 [Chaetomium fimeti]